MAKHPHAAAVTLLALGAEAPQHWAPLLTGQIVIASQLCIKEPGTMEFM